MIDFTCPCGRQYHFKDAAAGKMVRCKSCGEVFTVSAAAKPSIGADGDGDEPVDFGLGPPPASAAGASSSDSHDSGADDSGIIPIEERPEDKLRAKRARARVADPRIDPPASAAVPDAAQTATVGGDRATARLDRLLTNPDLDKQRTYWRDVGYAFSFVRNPTNLAGWAMLAMVLFFLENVPGILFIFIVKLIFIGMIYGFYMEIIRCAANGELDLPMIPMWENLIESLVIPIAQFVGTQVILILPAVLTFFYLRSEGRAGADLYTIPIILGAVGLFFWPVFLLAVSLGGLSVLARMDLIVRTVFSAPVPYLVTWAMVMGVTYLSVVGLEVAGASDADGVGGMISQVREPAAVSLGRSAARAVVESYVEIVTMFLIGLYYRHFKHRFPWTGG